MWLIAYGVPPRPGLGIVAGSTAVVSFGSARTSQVATLGINPSRVEFLDRAGHLLSGHARRLATLDDLGVGDLDRASPETIAAVVSDCDNYFQRNPYRQRFDQLDTVLRRCGASYYDGSACHLDLVQWATDPTWGKLTRTQRSTLLAEDLPFLRSQLESESIRALLLNGRAVLEAFSEATNCTLMPAEQLEFGSSSTAIRVGRLREIVVVAWTVNLQSSFGVTNDLRARLADVVAGLLA